MTTTDLLQNSDLTEESCPSSNLRLAQQPSPRLVSLVSLLSSCSSIGSELNKNPPPCPLCLDIMTPIDDQHPLQCPTRHCHYNFCASCIESLISSSKDDYEMASDGNAHVKVFLNCPNCRTDLSSTIRDTLLLRKVDTVTWLLTTKTTAGGGGGTDDSAVSLTPSQERTLAAMQELDIEEAIQKARDVESVFLRGRGSITTAASRRPSLSRMEQSIRELSLSPSPTAGMMPTSFEEHENENDEDEDDDEAWGVEADLISGVHNSIHLPRGQEVYSTNSSSNTNQLATSRQKKKKTIDPTVLQGLEFSMTYGEKLQVAQWMTSGITNDLASAARLFQELEQYARQGVSPAKRQARLRRGSVYEIVEETRKVHEKEEKKVDHYQQNEAATTTATTARSALPPHHVRGAGPQSRHKHGQQIMAERRQLEKTIQEQTYLLERFPLPVRMPKCVMLDYPQGNKKIDILTLARRFPLEFCNDTWDGTVLDAYSKITITGRPPNCTVTKKTTQHAGVYHVLSLGQYTQHYGPVEMTLDHPPRVLVASVQGEAGRKGIIKGDVVTHVDGDEFHGTVDELLELLHTKATTKASRQQQDQSQQQQHSKVEIIFNAEPSIAEALRRRATVLE